MSAQADDEEKIIEPSEPSDAAPEPNVPIQPEREEKIADRPHRFTLYASLGALCLSIVSIAVSIFGVRYNYLSLHTGQRAYLSFNVKFPDYKDDPGASPDDRIAQTVDVEVKNLGNTPAYDININVSKKPGSLHEFTIPQPQIHAIGPKDSAHGVIIDSSTRRTYREGLPGSGPQPCFTASYRDVFGDQQTDSYCFARGYEMKIEVYNPPRK